MGLHEYLNDRDVNADAALIDNQTPFLLMGGISTGQKALGYAPYLNDIWAGRKLLFHKPFRSMSAEEYKNYGNLGKKYFQDYLQHHPVNIKGYGKVQFGSDYNGKDFNFKREQYPFLRKQLYNSKKFNTTNNKGNTDKVFDHLHNTFRNKLYDYIIENNNDKGLYYKMLKEVSKE